MSLFALPNPSRSTAIFAFALSLSLVSCGEDTSPDERLTLEAGGRQGLLVTPFSAPAQRLLPSFLGLAEARSQVVYEVDLSEFQVAGIPKGWHRFERPEIGGFSLVRIVDGGPGDLEVGVSALEGPSHISVARLPVSSGEVPVQALEAREWIRNQLDKGDQREVGIQAEDAGGDELVASLAISDRFTEPHSSLVLISLDYKPDVSRFGRVQLRRVPAFEIQYQSAVYSTPDYSAGPTRGRVNLGGDHRDSLVLPVGQSGSVSVRTHEGADVLEFGLGALSGVDPLELHRLELDVSIQVAGGRVHAFPPFKLDPKQQDGDRIWREVSLPLTDLLPHGEASGVRVTFTATDPGETGRALAVAIAHPRIVGGSSGFPRPNLILVSLDTLRADRVGVIRTDGEPSLTPNLDAFSKGATLFSAAESTAPFTLPSHGSVFSGNMPSIHGGIDMQTPLRSDAPLLTELLALAGWSTTAFTGGGFLSPDFGFSRGFDRYTVHDPLITSETLPKLLDSERDRLPESMSGREYEDYLRLSAAWRLKKEAVLTYLASASRSPYFLFLHTYAAHQYHPPAAIYKVDLAGSESSLTFGKGLGPISPERWRTSPPSEADTLHMRQLYDACVRHADEEFGAVMESLKESGGLKNTYVVVFSDHGEELFEHGELGHSDSLRESLLHVPLLISGPGISPSRVTDPVSLLDLAPTLFELMGLPTTELFEGTSLLEFDGSHFSPRADSAPVFSEVSHHSFFFDSLRAGDWKVVREYGAAGRGVGTPVDRLYNLAQDGAEFTDLSGEESRLLERLGRRLTENRERLDAEAEGRTDSAAELSAGTMDALGDLGYL